MNFGDALEYLRLGRKLCRKGWNGKGMYIFLVPGSTITVEAGRPLGDANPELIGQTVTYQPHLDMKTAQNTIVPWLASQSDILADDWEVVN